MAFTAKEVLAGVYHIQDGMGVCMTLLSGDKAAVLVDTGYGLEDVRAFVRSLTSLPLTVILTHGHHDHCMGVKWFDRVLMFPEDRTDFSVYSGEATRRRVLQSAAGKGLKPDEDEYLTATLPVPETLQETALDLGGMTARIIHCPGHTPGSCVVHVPERSLLLTGDNWNPCTWLFFPAALAVRDYRRNVRGLLELDFENVLCSHQPELFSRHKMEAFLDALTDDALRAAPAVTVPPYDDVDTHQVNLPEHQMLVFDYTKAML